MSAGASPGVPLAKIRNGMGGGSGRASCRLFNAGWGSVAPQPTGIHTHTFPTERVKFSLPSGEIAERPLVNTALKQGVRFSTEGEQGYNLPLPCSQEGLPQAPRS